MRKELTKTDWISFKNDIFQVGDVLILHERIVHPKGQVLCEPNDQLVVVGADCIGCFVKNKSSPERNLSVPPNILECDKWMYDCWHCFNYSATLIRDEVENNP